MRRAALAALCVGALVMVGGAVAYLSYMVSPLATLALPAGGAFLVLACWRPLPAVCVAVSLAVAEAVQVPLGGLGALSATEASFLIVAVGWVWRAFTGHPGTRFPQVADYPQIALVLALLPGLAFGTPVTVVARLLVMWTAFYLVFLTVKAFDPSELRILMLALGIGGGLIATMGLLAYVRGGGTTVAAGGSSVTGRAAYGIPDPNYFAAYLVLAATPLFALVLAGQVRWRLIAAGSTGMCVLAIFASLSRGALLGLILSFAVVVVAWTRTRVASAAVGLVVISLTVVNLNPLLNSRATEVVGERITSVTASSQQNKRPLIWSKSLDLIAERPQGVGALQFGSVSGPLGLTERGSPLENVHNAYLNLAVELGVGGLLAYLLWNVRIAWDLVVEWRRRREQTFPLVVGLTGAFVGYAFQALTIVQYRVQTILATVFVLAGAAAAARAWPSPPEEPAVTPPSAALLHAAEGRTDAP